MNPTFHRVLWSACLVSAGALLAACGGGGGGSEPAAPAAQTLSFTAPANQAFSTTPVALVASASSGLEVSLASSTPTVCTVASTSATLVGVGTCTITASQAGNANFVAATAVVQSFVVSQGAQTITFVSPGNQTLGTAPAALMANASSGLSVTFASSTPAVCTVNGTALSLVAAGNCTVAASQAGTANYAAAPQVAHTFAVAVQMAAQTISFTAPGNQVLGSAAPALVATASSGLPVAFASTTPTICTVNGTALTLLLPGTCTVAASQAGNATFGAAAAVLNSFAVAATPQTITFVSPGAQTLGSTPPALVASASSGLAVTFTSSTPSVCTVNGTALSLLSTGTCTVAANQTGSTTVAPASAVQQSFAVAAAAQTITFAGPGPLTLGTTPAALVASASSGLPVTIASTTPGVCTTNGSALTLVAAGNCSLTASQAGNASFAAAVAVTRTVVVNPPGPVAQTITFASPGNQTLGSTPAALVATASSGLPVTLASTTPAICTVNGTTLTLVAAGSCTVSASQAGNAGFNPATAVTQTFTVSTAAQTITFASPGPKTMGTPAGALVATASSGLPVSFLSTTPTVCTVSGTALTLVSAGTCTLSANQAGNTNFAAATPVVQSFLVSTAAQTITFVLPANGTVGVAQAALAASASSGLPVSYASTTPAVCTVSGTTLTLVAAGTCSVTANQAGNATFAPATSVTRTQTVAPAPLSAQTINFTGPALSQSLGTLPGALVASASSGLSVSFASTTPAVCTVTGTTLTLVAQGECVVVASQAGNAAFLPAANVSRTFTVSRTAQTVTFVPVGSQTAGTTAALSATASSGLTVSFASSTPGVCTVSGTTLTLVAAGSCTVTASQAGNATFAPASQAQTFAVAAAAPIELISNGGFETAPALPGQFALGWRGVNGVRATRSTDARSGSGSASLAIPDPGLNGSGFAGNSVDDGGKAPITGLYVGKTTTLTFWAKGSVSRTGNVNFSLRYLDAVGNILNPVVNTSFGGQINVNGWTLITLNGPAIPAATSAIFVEMTLAVGPTGPQTPPATHCGEGATVCDFGQARVLIDDLSVVVNP